MRESARTKFGVVWSRAGSEARLCNVPMAVQVVHGQYGEGSYGEKFVGGVQMEATTVQLLLHIADDLVLVAKKDEDVESDLRKLDGSDGKWKIQINWKKTKVLAVKGGGGTCDVSVKGEEIEESNEVPRSVFNEEGPYEEEIANRIGAALKVIGGI